MKHITEILSNAPMPDGEERPGQNVVAVADSGLCNPNCERCGGTGYIRYVVDISDARFGKLFPCPNSDPFKRYKGIIGIYPDEYKMSWAGITKNGSVASAISAVKNAIERGYGWVTIWGGYGLAKTMILKTAVAEYVRNSKNPAAYTRMAEIIDHLRGAFDEYNPSSESNARLDLWSELPLLCIDEFDRVRATEYANERRFVLMDRRYEAACRQKSITIMALNTNPADMEDYLSDRMFDGRFSVVKLTGNSARPTMGY